MMADMYIYYHLRLARRPVFQVDFVEASYSFTLDMAAEISYILERGL
jgi:hypothetical protein